MSTNTCPAPTLADDPKLIAELPAVFDEKEFTACTEAFKADHLDVPLRQMYVKRGAAYVRRDGGAKFATDLVRLWDKHAAVNREKWCSRVAVCIVAQYIYEHRLKVGRKGDQMDDFVKAEYLVGLVAYLNSKRSSVIRLCQDDEMEEIIDAVNNIFDSAYFRKMHHPELTDVECFLEAEREFCEDKQIDFLLYQRRLEPSAAERLHAEQNIRVLAYMNFEFRQATGRPGSDLQDWLEAEKRYPEWRTKKRLATICWNLASEKHRSQDYYWLQACRVIDELERQGIPYLNASPYAPEIYRVITQIAGSN